MTDNEMIQMYIDKLKQQRSLTRELVKTLRRACLRLGPQEEGDTFMKEVYALITRAEKELL